MKAIYDRERALGEGLAAIRTQFQLPADSRPRPRRLLPRRRGERRWDHVDRTATLFVTLDPTSSTDLDQAFAIEQSGGDLILRYAIADIGWFVADEGPVDIEAWARGETIYMPDGKVSLYPTALSEGAASLLPDADKPAIVFAVRVAGDGTSTLDSAERAIVRSRAKLGYATVRPEDLPAGFTELSRRIEAAELARGASRVDPPQQEVVEEGDCFRLEFRPMQDAERSNATLSLAANLAIADLLYRHGTGLFRVMPSRTIGRSDDCATVPRRSASNGPKAWGLRRDSAISTPTIPSRLHSCWPSAELGLMRATLRSEKANGRGIRRCGPLMSTPPRRFAGSPIALLRKPRSPSRTATACRMA